MKHILTTLALTAALGAAQAQTEHDSTALAGMTKIQLTNIYIEEACRVATKMKTVAWADIDGSVPKNKYTAGRFAKVAKQQDNYVRTINAQLRDIVPYADKHEIINAILYFKGL
jgi:hypothetical protein